ANDGPARIAGAAAGAGAGAADRHRRGDRNRARNEAETGRQVEHRTAVAGRRISIGLRGIDRALQGRCVIADAIAFHALGAAVYLREGEVGVRRRQHRVAGICQHSGRRLSPGQDWDWRQCDGERGDGGEGRSAGPRHHRASNTTMVEPAALTAWTWLATTVALSQHIEPPWWPR